MQWNGITPQSSDLDTAKVVWDPLDKERANTPTPKKL